MVLILVLVEDGLGEGENIVQINLVVLVLILVLVEDGLGVLLNGATSWTLYSLNPCFSGGWSRRSLELLEPYCSRS